MVERLGNGVFSLCEWLARLAVLNGLWVVFMLAGLGIFGWAPATAAVFSVLRTAFLNGGLAQLETRSMYQDFKSVFKEEFFQANAVGLLLLWGGVLLYVSGWSMTAMDVSLFPRLLLIGVVSLFLLIFLLVFPVRAHFQTSVKNSVQYSLLLGLANLPAVLLVLAGTGGLGILFLMMPGVMVFYGVSLPATVIMHQSLHLFRKNGVEA
ncbi:YesL family protein [Salibacterium aidingense]|uniref:YesL family protein n=1 Tax=Salibacterium aidingense TaxID=384933 RepID=UPI0004116C85|nr:DUF624 domain-containing protein [Salibacterium aidingense]